MEGVTVGRDVPVVYLLVGLTGSGKTTYSRQRLEPAGAVRLSVDEVVHDRYGRYGVDYPENTYFAKEAPVVAELQGGWRGWWRRAWMWCGTTGCGLASTGMR